MNNKYKILLKNLTYAIIIIVMPCNSIAEKEILEVTKPQIKPEVAKSTTTHSEATVIENDKLVSDQSETAESKSTETASNKTEAIESKTDTTENPQPKTSDSIQVNSATNKLKFKKTKIIKKQKSSNIQLMLMHGDIDKALKLLESQNYQDRSWKSFFWLGTAYLLKGQLDDAAQALDNALAQQSGIAEIWVQRATVEHERNNLTATVQLLQVALQIDPKNAKAYLNLAYAYDALEKPEQAKTAYRYYLKFTEGNTLNDIRLKQKIITNIIKKTS